MAIQRSLHITLAVLLLAVAGLELWSIFQYGWVSQEDWFVLLLPCLGAAILLIRPNADAVLQVAALLVSLPWLYIEPAETAIGLGRVIDILWRCLRTLIPFVFVHLALVFPAPSLVMNRWPRRTLLFIYVPYVLVSLVLALAEGQLLLYTEKYVVYLIPAGFLGGVALLVYHFLYSLTAAEKNRLRIVLAGCLTGGMPLLLSAIGEEPAPSWLLRLAWFLVPVFPVSLVLAVVKENFAELSRRHFRLLVLFHSAAASVTLFFLSYRGVSLLMGSEVPHLWAVSLVVSLVMSYPLNRWAGAYLGARFPVAAPFSDVGRPYQIPEYQPIHPNPYVVGSPVREPEMFFGRHEDFEFIRDKLHAHRQGMLVLLCGRRRTGKTSILYQVLNGRLGPDYLPVFIDMQGLVVKTDDEFAHALASLISDAVRAEIPEFSAGPGEDQARDYLSLSAFLDRVMRHLRDRRLLLLIDEYELIGEKIKEGKLSPGVYDFLDSLLARHGRLSLVLTGSRGLENFPAMAALLGKAFYREVSFLAAKDAEAVIRMPLRERVVLKDEAVHDMLVLTHGQPFFTQLLCQCLVEVINETRNPFVSSQTVAEVTRRVMANPPPQLFYEWSVFSRPQKLVLAGLATLIRKPEAYVSSERVERLIETLPEANRLDPVEVRMTLEGLRHKKTLDRDQTRYRFTMDLMRLFVRSEHNVWNVLNQIAQS